MNNSSALGIIGKALSGAASVAVPMALEEHRARIQALRDERLQQYRSKEIEGQQQLQRDLSAAQIQATRDEGKATREHQAEMQRNEQTFRGEQYGYDRALKADELKLHQQRMESDDDYRTGQLEIAREQLNVTKEGHEIEKQINQLKLDRYEDQQKALAIIGSPDLDEATRQAAMDYLNYSGAHKKNVVIKQIQDEEGNYVDDFAVFVDGKRTDYTPVAGAGGSDVPDLKTPDEVRAAFRAGKIGRSEAYRLLDALKAAEE